MQDEVYQNLVSIFTDVFDERLGLESLSHSIGSQPILRKRVIKVVDNYNMKDYAQVQEWWCDKYHRYQQQTIAPIS